MMAVGVERGEQMPNTCVLLQAGLESIVGESLRVERLVRQAGGAPQGQRASQFLFRQYPDNSCAL